MSIAQSQLPSYKKANRFFVILIVITLIITGAANIFHLGWVAATAWAFGMYALVLGYAIAKKDEMVGDFLLYGTIVGFLELPADSWAVRNIDALVYYKGGLFIWDSPLYMPYFWAYMLALLGYVAVQFNKKFGLLKTSIAYGIFGIAIGPGMEFLASGAKWWYYHNCKALFGTPYYIIGGEILIFLAIPYTAQAIHGSKRKDIVVYSFCYAIFMFFAYALVYYTFDIGAIR